MSGTNRWQSRDGRAEAWRESTVDLAWTWRVRESVAHPWGPPATSPSIKAAVERCGQQLDRLDRGAELRAALPALQRQRAWLATLPTLAQPAAHAAAPTWRLIQRDVYERHDGVRVVRSLGAGRPPEWGWVGPGLREPHHFPYESAAAAMAACDLDYPTAPEARP